MTMALHHVPGVGNQRIHLGPSEFTNWTPWPWNPNTMWYSKPTIKLGSHPTIKPGVPLKIMPSRGNTRTSIREGLWYWRDISFNRLWR